MGYRQTTKSRVTAALIGIGLAAFALAQPASAGFFDRLFGGLRSAAPARAPAEQPFVDPFTALANHFNPQQQERLRGDNNGPARAFCVRTCDGRFFPVQANANMSAADSCRSFCPATETRLYAGTNIDYATSTDGSRYADLPNAFLYRKQLVTGCSCNGRNAFGLAQIATDHDPTLRQGDIVATKDGLMAFTGARNNVADFTPVENYSRLSKSARERLAETRIAPASPQTLASGDITASIPPAAAQARAEVPPRRQPLR
jgi:hypothetical protein